MMAKWSKFGVGYVLNATSPEIMTSHRLHFAKAAGAIQVGNFVRHGVNPLRYTQLRTIWGSEYEVDKGSPTPSGAEDLPLHRERGAERSLKTGVMEGYGSQGPRPPSGAGSREESEDQS